MTQLCIFSTDQLVWDNGGAKNNREELDNSEKFLSQYDQLRDNVCINNKSGAG